MNQIQPISHSIDHKVERVEFDNVPSDWYQAEVISLWDTDDTRLQNTLETQIFFHSNGGHRLNIKRRVYASLNLFHSHSSSSEIMSHEFTLLELKVLADVLNQFIATADADEFGQDD